MKKILFALLAVVLLMSACSKDENHPLAGTEWSENFQGNEDGIKYNFMMKLSFIDAKTATIQNKKTAEHTSSTTDFTATAQYTYDNTTKKGTITTTSAGETATLPFEINGNKLSLTVDIEDNEIVVLTRTK